MQKPLKLSQATFHTLGLVVIALLHACATQEPPKQQQTLVQEPSRPPLKADLGLWADKVLHTPKPDPAYARIFNLRVENLKASHVLELLSQELNIGYDMDTCGEVPVSLVGKQMPLQTVLDSLAAQTESTIDFKPGQISLRCESDELRIYKLDYLSIARNMSDSSSLSSAISGNQSGLADRREQGNRSELLLNNRQNHDLWDNITIQIEQLIQTLPRPQEITSKERVRDDETDRAFETNRSGARSAFQTPRKSATQTSANRREFETTRKEVRSGRVVANAESGTVAVIAKPTQHQRVNNWLSQVQRRADRQIVIEAVITEISLSKRYERGIDWNVLRTNGSTAGLLVQGLNLQNPAFTFTVARNTGNTDAAVVLKLLEEFGRTSVLSSPRVVAMNQQASVLKVIDNRVYFTTDVQTSAPTQSSPAFSTFTTQVQTVPVGFLMTVTPQISDHNAIQLRVRPTLSRIVGFVQDPNPALRQLNIISQVPEIQTRELESILKLRNGEMALLGGLRQKENQQLDRGIPGAPDALNPLTDSTTQGENHIELVVLLKATVLDTPSPFDTSIELHASRHLKQLEQTLVESLGLARNGQIAEARTALSLISEQHPTAPEPHYNLAILSALAGHLPSAKQSLSKAEALCGRIDCTLPLITLRALLENAR